MTLPDGVNEKEANLILAGFATLKKGGFGKLELVIVDGKLVDATSALKENHNRLKELYTA